MVFFLWRCSRCSLCHEYVPPQDAEKQVYGLCTIDAYDAYRPAGDLRNPDAKVTILTNKCSTDNIISKLLYYLVSLHDFEARAENELLL